MAWKFFLIFVAVAYYITLLFSLPPVDNEVAVEVIFGKGDGTNASRLPPLFAHGGVSRYAPEFTLDSIQAAREARAAGIELDLSFTRDNVGVLFYDDNLERTTSSEGFLANTSFADLRQVDAMSNDPLSKKCRDCTRVPTLQEGIHECLRQGVRFIIHVKRYDDRAVALLGVLFSQWPELYRLGLVSSPNAEFIYALRLKYPDIVTALTWRPGLLAYEDPERRRPRYELPNKQYKAVIADWLLEQALNTGLLHYITGASAVLLWKDRLNFDSVRTWHNRGVESGQVVPGRALGMRPLGPGLGSPSSIHHWAGLARLRQASGPGRAGPQNCGPCTPLGHTMMCFTFQ
ncbi:hypothetical protein MRX96_050101 [Rhipicephalus microplus]